MDTSYLPAPIFFAIAFVFSMLGMGGSQLYIPILFWTGMEIKTEAIPLGMLLNLVNSSSAAITYSHITLYERDDQLGGRSREAAQVPYKEEFADLVRYQQVQLQRTGVEVVRFETDEQGQTTVVARPWPHQEDASALRFPAETVIIAMGLRADRSLADALADQPDVYTIGDCVEPREVLDAIYEGFEVGRTV